MTCLRQQVQPGLEPGQVGPEAPGLTITQNQVTSQFISFTMSIRASDHQSKPEETSSPDHPPLTWRPSTNSSLFFEEAVSTVRFRALSLPYYPCPGLLCVVLGTEPRALHVLSIHTSTELHPCPILAPYTDFSYVPIG